MADAARQEFPFPAELAELVANLSYRPGWSFSLRDIERDPGSSGLTLEVISLGYDSYHPDQGETYRVRHYFPVPPATFNRQSWAKWLLDQLISIETHEACEFFALDGDRPFAPHHGPGNNPYTVFVHGSDEDRRTSFRGKVKPADA